MDYKYPSAPGGESHNQRHTMPHTTISYNEQFQSISALGRFSRLAFIGCLLFFAAFTSHRFVCICFRTTHFSVDKDMWFLCTGRLSFCYDHFIATHSHCKICKNKHSNEESNRLSNQKLVGESSAILVYYNSGKRPLPTSST